MIRPEIKNNHLVTIFSRISLMWKRNVNGFFQNEIHKIIKPNCYSNLLTGVIPLFHSEESPSFIQRYAKLSTKNDVLSALGSLPQSPYSKYFTSSSLKDYFRYFLWSWLWKHMQSEMAYQFIQTGLKTWAIDKTPANTIPVCKSCHKVASCLTHRWLFLSLGCLCKH